MTDQRERAEEFVEELRGVSEPSDRSIQEVVQALRPQLQELVNKEVELAKTELAPVGRQAGLAAGLLAVGAVFMFVFLLLAAFTVGYVLSLFLPMWAAFLIVSGALLIVGGVLAGAGASILRRLDPKPQRTIHTLQQNVNWLREQFRS